MCIFCKIINKEIPSNVVYEDHETIAILDITQATKGHTLVIPKKHYDNFNELPSDLLNKVMTTSQIISKRLIQSLKADGCNILTNINEAAGQSVFHTHIHIIPRYKKDDLIIKFKKHDVDFNNLLEKIKSGSK